MPAVKHIQQVRIRTAGSMTTGGKRKKVATGQNLNYTKYGLGTRKRIMQEK